MGSVTLDQGFWPSMNLDQRVDTDSVAEDPVMTGPGVAGVHMFRFRGDPGVSVDVGLTERVTASSDAKLVLREVSEQVPLCL